MIRTTLASAIAASNPAFTAGAASNGLAVITATIAQELRAGRSVVLPGLGVLRPVLAAARKGRNPKNPGITIDIPAKRRVKFIAAKTLLATL